MISLFCEILIINFFLIFRSLRIPFATSAEAEIAFNVLRVDQEPRRNFVEKQLSLDGEYLQVQLKADQVKNLRTAITSFFEALLLCTDTLREFAPLTPQVVHNAGAHTGANTA